jgi:hypothetical protein
MLMPCGRQGSGERRKKASVKDAMPIKKIGIKIIRNIFLLTLDAQAVCAERVVKKSSNRLMLTRKR